MNGLEGEKMTMELNRNEELKVFSIIIEEVDNKSTYSVIRRLSSGIKAVEYNHTQNGLQSMQ